MANIDLCFSPNQSIKDIPVFIDGEKLLKALIKHDFETINLNWHDLFQVQLFVEDDVLFLVDAYNELSELESTETQSIYLGDGGFELDIKLLADSVKIKATYTPYLDKRFSEKKELMLTKESYFQSWNSLMEDLLGPIGLCLDRCSPVIP